MINIYKYINPNLNAYYAMPVMTSPDYIGERYKASMIYATACIHRKKGNYISKDT